MGVLESAEVSGPPYHASYLSTCWLPMLVEAFHFNILRLVTDVITIGFRVLEYILYP